MKVSMEIPPDKRFLVNTRMILAALVNFPLVLSNAMLPLTLKTTLQSMLPFAVALFSFMMYGDAMTYN